MPQRYGLHGLQMCSERGRLGRCIFNAEREKPRSVRLRDEGVKGATTAVCGHLHRINVIIYAQISWFRPQVVRGGAGSYMYMDEHQPGSRCSSSLVLFSVAKGSPYHASYSFAFPQKLFKVLKFAAVFHHLVELGLGLIKLSWAPHPARSRQCLLLLSRNSTAMITYSMTLPALSTTTRS